MTYILSYVYKSYTFAIEELADPRLEDWFLMDSAIKIVSIIATYFYIIKKLGPTLMANRQPFNIDKLLIAYNAGQMLINGYICYTLGKIMFKNFNTYCNEIDYSNDPDAITMLKAIYLYFLTKVIDLLDTVFFVMRKKDNQVTFLHMYHHSMMVLLTWVASKFIGGGQIAICPFVNSFAHVCMYGYYLLSVWDKNVKTSVRWKRHITEIQLLQFLIGVYFMIGPLLTKGCTYPKYVCILMSVQLIFMTVLFGDFYLKAYIYTKHKSKNAQC